MIKSFHHKGLKQLVESGKSKAVRPDLISRSLKILDYLDAAETVTDMNVAGLRLHELKGDRKGIWSVVVSGNWRITFAFENGNAFDVDLEDYH